MTLHLKHKFNIAKADGADPTEVRPSNWNDDHLLSTAAGVLVGSDTSGPASVQELPGAFDPAGNFELTAATGYFLGAQGTTAQRPSGVPGFRRYNVTTNKEEFWDSSAWQNVATESYVTTAITALGGFTTGDVKLTLKQTADAGWVLFNNGTIGSAASGATFADPTAMALFQFMWTNFNNGLAPVSGGRGVSWSADWASNKTLQLLTPVGNFLSFGGGGNVGQHNGGAASVGIDISNLPFTYGNSTPSTGGGNVQGVTPQGPAPLNILNPGIYINAMVKL